MSDFIANWCAPDNIRALTTTRSTGNLAMHVNDNPNDVLVNRITLLKKLSLPNEPIWLQQIHSNTCIVVEENSNRIADAAITRQTNNCLVIMTADCLPITLCNRDGTEIAAIHAGWKGLVSGIIGNTLRQMNSKSEEIVAWIGPAICQNCYEVGLEVKEIFEKQFSFTAPAFRQENKKAFANLPKIAELILNANGVSAVYQSQACTFEQEENFYSYRRQTQTGRMATLIWFNRIQK